MRQQTKKLFYISKQLASNNLSQLLDGLSNSRQFISEAPSHQFLNTLIMSLLDLFANTKNTYVRYLIVSILSQAHTFISQLPSKPEIASIFYDWLKSNDIGIRMLGFKVVQSLYVIFERDSSIYHYLLSKLRTLQSSDNIKNQRMSNPNNLIDTPINKQQLKKQAVGVLKCLHSLVTNSQFLSSNLSNNLYELYSLGQINIKILLYLSVYAKFQSSAYFKVLKTLWNIYCNQNRQNYSQNFGGYIKKSRKINYYFSKLIIKSCYHNYMCIYLYQKVLQPNFSHLQKSIVKIQNIQYSFLGSIGLLPNNLISSEQLLDLCYQQFNIKYNISAQLQKRILQNIQHHIQTKKVDQNSLLLTFYLSVQSRKFNQVDQKLTTQFIQNFASYAQNQIKKYIKISLTVANYKLAHRIIEYGMNKIAKINQRIMSVMMLFSCYCSLHLEESEQLLEIFFAVARNLSQARQHNNFSKLVSLWQKQYKNIDIQYNNSRENAQNGNSSQKIRKQNQITIRCMQQLSLYEQTSKQKNMHNNFPKIPLFQQKKIYNKIYFGKQTILDIFRYL